MAAAPFSAMAETLAHVTALSQGLAEQLSDHVAQISKAAQPACEQVATLRRAQSTLAHLHTLAAELRDTLRSNAVELEAARRAAHVVAAEAAFAQNMRAPLVRALDGKRELLDLVCSVDNMTFADRHSFRGSCRSARHAGANISLVLSMSVLNTPTLCVARPIGAPPATGAAGGGTSRQLHWARVGSHFLESSTLVVAVATAGASVSLVLCGKRSTNIRRVEGAGGGPPRARKQGTVQLRAPLRLSASGVPARLQFEPSAEDGPVAAHLAVTCHGQARAEAERTRVSHFLDCGSSTPAVLSAFVCAVDGATAAVAVADGAGPGASECVRQVASFPAALIERRGGPWCYHVNLAAAATAGQPAVCLALRRYMHAPATHQLCHTLGGASATQRFGAVALLPLIKLKGGDAMPWDLPAPPRPVRACRAWPCAALADAPFFGHHATLDGQPMLRYIANARADKPSRRVGAKRSLEDGGLLTVQIVDGAGLVRLSAKTSLEGLASAARRGAAAAAELEQAACTADVLSAAGPAAVAAHAAAVDADATKAPGEPRSRLRVLFSAGVQEAEQDGLLRLREFASAHCAPVCVWADHAPCADRDEDQGHQAADLGPGQAGLCGESGYLALYADLLDAPAAADRASCYFLVGDSVVRLDVPAREDALAATVVAAAEDALRRAGVAGARVTGHNFEADTSDCPELCAGQLSVPRMAEQSFQSTGLASKLEACLLFDGLPDDRRLRLVKLRALVERHGREGCGRACVLQVTTWRERPLCVLDQPVVDRSEPLGRAQRLLLLGLRQMALGAARFKQISVGGAMTAHCLLPPNETGMGWGSGQALLVCHVHGPAGGRGPLHADVALLNDHRSWKTLSLDSVLPVSAECR
jgi:hypothetical protein